MGAGVRPARSTAGAAPDGLSALLSLLRCLECGGAVEVEHVERPGGYPELGPDGRLRCRACGEGYPLIAGTPRMLRAPLRERLRHDYPRAVGALGPASGPRGGEAEDGEAEDGEARVRQRTADSFAYEWEHFGALRAEWRRNFLDYMRPHTEEQFRGLVMLDVGAGSGRHSFQAAALGARVVAVDLGRSIDVARRNLPAEVLTVQADAERLPFDAGAFDLVASIGVLHHLPDPERAFRSIVPFARPGGRVQVYLYWWPERGWHRRVLRLVSALRRITVRMPPRLLHAACYPLAAVLLALVVLPYRLLRRAPGPAGRLAGAFPLKTYADYPFGVLVNDQFDRFSAPLERRYEASEVERWLAAAGLDDRRVLPNHGWLGSGRVPARR